MIVFCDWFSTGSVPHLLAIVMAGALPDPLPGPAKSDAPRSKLESGFSLIELVIALIIVSVMGALAYPSYLDIINKNRRAEARSALLATMLYQERYYSQHNAYFAFNAATPASPFKWWSGSSPKTSYYEITATPCPDQTLAQCVLLKADPGTDRVKSYSDPVCGALMLDSSSHQTYSLGSQSTSPCW